MRRYYFRPPMFRTSTVALCVSLSALLLAGCGRGTLSVPPLAAVPACRAPIASLSPVTWLDPPGAAKRTGDWCDAVGPVFRAAFAPRRDAAVSRPVLVVSWNVDVGAGDVRRLVRMLTEGERAAGRADPDIILLLQEAYRTGTAIPAVVRAAGVVPRRIARGARTGRDVERLARALRMNVLYVPSMRNGAGDPSEDRGNAILSTLPLENETAIELPLEHQRRVAIGATVRVSGMPLFVVSVHLDTRAPWYLGSVFAGPSARHRQARALMAALASITAAAPAIIAGDFNTLGGAGEPAVATVERRFPLVSCGDPRTHAWRLRLDYVFASDVALVGDCNRLGARLGSDHHPLVARIDVERAGGVARSGF